MISVAKKVSLLYLVKKEPKQKELYEHFQVTYQISLEKSLNENSKVPCKYFEKVV